MSKKRKAQNCVGVTDSTSNKATNKTSNKATNSTSDRDHGTQTSSSSSNCMDCNR